MDEKGPVEPIEGLAGPGIVPYVLVDEKGEPVRMTYGNGGVFVAGFKKPWTARTGQIKWGGRIWDRVQKKFVGLF